MLKWKYYSWSQTRFFLPISKLPVRGLNRKCHYGFCFYLLWGHVDFWSFEANFFCHFIYLYFFDLKIYWFNSQNPLYLYGGKCWTKLWWCLRPLGYIYDCGLPRFTGITNSGDCWAIINVNIVQELRRKIENKLNPVIEITDSKLFSRKVLAERSSRWTAAVPEWFRNSNFVLW